MKIKTILASALAVVLISQTIYASPASISGSKATSEYLDICKEEEAKYSNIPDGFIQAIVSSPPSSIYQVGPMHIFPEEYADEMTKLKVADMEKPTSNIALGAYRISQLFNKYHDHNLVLVNYFHAKEEQADYIADVLKKYHEIHSDAISRK